MVNEKYCIWISLCKHNKDVSLKEFIEMQSEIDLIEEIKTQIQIKKALKKQMNEKMSNIKKNASANVMSSKIFEKVQAVNEEEDD